MDGCHKIGQSQTKPIHVYRLATAESVEDRMPKRAFSKLKLEHVVIGKGHFKQERTKASSTKPMEANIVTGKDATVRRILLRKRMQLKL
ncbi:ATP-dependent DNA helicase DDM1 [Artemisia annua]|uniref:Chromatin-remodeling ATPase INO80 n=1 Tax=Artemisia annua TaxID=35608 RepID=A0A2U1MN34_ARTAN|nr:ATP-dependent DNA helicase DDM1 [Artemisia annua]